MRHIKGGWVEDCSRFVAKEVASGTNSSECSLRWKQRDTNDLCWSVLEKVLVGWLGRGARGRCRFSLVAMLGDDCAAAAHECRGILTAFSETTLIPGGK